MIIQTGQRTDIPAFYSDWFANRLDEGYVLSRNPYNPSQVTKYRLDPSVVDVIAFCTKNPHPMLRYMDKLEPYPQYWFVTITPYGKEIEPNVPHVDKVIEDVKILSQRLGKNCIGWRYDPIFVSEKYPVERHIRAFEYIAEKLSGYAGMAVISFIDLYSKVVRNFPEAREVSASDRVTLAKAFVPVAERCGMILKSCAEGDELAEYGVDVSGCMTQKVYETALGSKLRFPSSFSSRKECACYLSGDIGAYNSCAHFCRYCYANFDKETVLANMRQHDPKSPFLIGNERPGDIIKEAKQESWIDGQLTFDRI